MSPIHYDDFPKTINECWELLGPENQADAISAFIKIGHEKHESELTKFKKVVLKLSGSANLPKFFDSWTLERQVSKALNVVERDKVREFKDNFVRYWILNNRRSQICGFLDAASVPHENGYIEDNYNQATEEMWSRGLNKIWDYDELFVKMYLGYILLSTRKGKTDNLWTPLALALGKDKPKEVDVQNEIATTQSKAPVELVDSTKPTKVEDSGEFLLYEQQLIKSLAQGAISRTSSLDAVDAVDMARQLIDDAPSKPRLFFMLGFAQALHALPADLSDIKGITNDRQCWFYCGYLNGLARNFNANDIYKFITETKSIFKYFSGNPKSPAFAQAGQIICKSLVDAENDNLFCELLEIVDEVDSVSLVLNSLYGGNEMARELVSQGKYDLAFKLNSRLIKLATKWEKTEEDFSIIFSKIKGRLMIREAIIALGKKDFEGARSKFGKMAAGAQGSDKIEIRAWIAMANAGIPDFFLVFPSGDKETFSRIGEKMLAVLREISQQPDGLKKRSHIVSVCAGIAEFCERRYDKAYGHFVNAAEAITRQGRPITNSLNLWVRFMRSSSQLMSLDTSSVEVLVADFEAIQESKIKPANWFYADLVESATLFSDPKLLNVVLSSVPAEDGEKYFAVYEISGTLPIDVSKRIAYAQWLPNSKRKKQEIFKCLSNVIKWDIQSAKTDAALLAIDALESLAEESDQLSSDLYEFILNQQLSPDVLEDAELFELKLKLLLRLKRNQEAQQVLIDRFLRYATSTSDWKRQQAHHFLSELLELGIDLTSVETAVKKLQHEYRGDEANEDAINLSDDIKILCVGGNEIQKRYESEIVRELRQKYPKLNVEFIYSGWTYNYTPYVDSIKSKIPSSDGLVLSYMVRTNFGRIVRKISTDNCPWWACPGHGKDSIKRAIIAAATHAAKRKSHDKKS